MDLLMPDAPGADPAMRLALEEALVRAVPLVPVLRIWQNEACVVLGRGQRIEREVNVAAAAAARVPVLRRASGGGTVYHDLGNLTITIAVPGWVPGLTSDLAALVAGVLRRSGLAPVTTERGVFAGSLNGPVNRPVTGLVKPGMSVPAARRLVLAEAADRYGPLTPRPVTAAETCWQRRLMAQRYGSSAWHMTGRAPTMRTEEAQWTTKPALTCTG
jgi:lipoate-protein ligase A